MTLRLRLLLLLAGIVAAGLVISDVATYTSLRSFLVTRLDQQLEVARFPVDRALDTAAGLSTGTRSPGDGRAQAVRAGTGAAGTSATPGTGPAPSPTGSGGRRPGPAARGQLVPPGTFGELRSASGRVVVTEFFTYGGSSPAVPALPAHLPGSGSSTTQPVFFDASPASGSGAAYRVVAATRPGGGTVVVGIPLAEVAATLDRLLVIEGAVTLVVLALLGGVAWFLLRRDLRPLEGMAGTATAIAAGDLSLRVGPVGSGEVARLASAFDSMLARIEEAFTARTASEARLRRFVADASHELRTPLTSIRGYAELFDLGVRDRPADLDRAMSAISGEAARMSTVVDDLLTLAALDQEPEPVHRAVDVVEVATRSVDAFRVAHPDRRITLRVGAGPCTVAGDPARLRQVVDNLVGNAVRHAPAPAAVEVRVAAASGDVVLEVADEGPGVAPDDAERIFEPFTRLDPSRARATGGAGLGLAIVRAVVEAHGGDVGVVPTPAGATFRVRLPAAEEDDAGERDVGERDGAHGDGTDRDRGERGRGHDNASGPVNRGRSPRTVNVGRDHRGEDPAPGRENVVSTTDGDQPVTI